MFTPFNELHPSITIEGASALSLTKCKRLRNGDTVGTVYTGTAGAQYWIQGRVIGNDTRDGILFVQHGSDPITSYWYSEGDEIAAWPATSTDRTGN